MELQNRIQIESSQFIEFSSLYLSDYRPAGLRYGEAFYNHFNLYNCNFTGEVAKAMNKLYNTEHVQVALSIILHNFQFN